jgi:hypothetical protein
MASEPSQAPEKSQTSKQWARVVAQAWTDENFKKRLAENPAVVLREHGIQVPTGTELRLVENTDKVAYITLPAKPFGSELSISELEGIAGGDNPGVWLGICYVPCQIEIGPVTVTSSGKAAE